MSLPASLFNPPSFRLTTLGSQTKKQAHLNQMEAGLWLNRKVREALALLVANFVPTDVIVILFGQSLGLALLPLHLIHSAAIVAMRRTFKNDRRISSNLKYFHLVYQRDLAFGRDLATGSMSINIGCQAILAKEQTVMPDDQRHRPLQRLVKEPCTSLCPLHLQKLHLLVTRC